MHLTSLGKIENSVTALTTLIQNGQKGNLLLANSIKLLSTEEKIAVVSRLALTEQQKIGLLATAGLTKEELKNVVSTGALQVAQDGATGSTFSLTAALQGLKTAVLTNPLLMATAVVAGLFTVYKVVDLLTVSFEEQKEIVNDLTSEVNDLQSEYDKLKADPSVNSNKLSALKRELEIKKDILEIEKETLALKDMQENMPDISNKTGTSGGHVNPTWTPEDTAETDIRGDLQKLYQARNNMSNIDSIIPVAQDMVMQGYVQQEADALKELSEHTNTLQKEYLEIADAKAKLEQYVEDGTLKGVNADLARKQIAEYQAEIDRLDPIILNAEIELGTANFEDKYNAYLDKIKKANSMENLGVSEDKYRDVGYGGTLIKSSELDSLIDKNKELNTTFQSGEITASEYFNSLSKMFEKGGKIADAYDKLDFDRVANESGKWVLNSTDYLEETVSQLVSQITDATYEVTNAFARGDISVKEYYDSLQESADAQLKALKTTNKLVIGTDELAYATEDSSEQSKQAVEHYNELHNQLEEMDIMEQLVDVNTKYADTLDDIGTATEDMLNDASIQNYVSEASNAVASYMQQMHSYYEATGQDFQTLVDYFNEVAGSSFTAQELLSKNSADIISNYFGDTMSGVTDLATAIATMTGDVIADGASKIGDVLTALGDTISNFDYTLNISTEAFDIPWSDIISIKGISLPPISAAINFDGSGESVGSLGEAIKGVGDWVKTDATQLALKNIIGNFNSWKPKNSGTSPTTPAVPPSNNPKSPSGSKGSGGSSSSKKDPHIAEVDKYKNLTDAVDEYDRKLQQLERTYDNTDSVEERIGLKKAEIKLYKEQKDAIDALNKARDEEISDKVNKLRGQGFKIDYDPATDNLLIHNREHINDLNQSIIEEYEEIIDRVDELNDANKDSADQWDELTSSIVKAGKELKDLEQEKFEDYIEGAEHLLRLMENRKDAFGKESAVYTNMMEKTLLRWKDLVTTDYQGNIDQIRELEEQWMDFYDARIEKEKEILEMQLDDNDRVLDGVIKVIDDQIKALDDQIDGLSKANDERKKALELQKAQAELDKARNQKTRHVLRKGVGWVWEADDDAIKEAEENLSDLEYESKTDALEKEKEALEDLKEKWEEIPDIAEDEQNRLLMIEKLGADAEADILDDRIDVYEDFKDDYIDIQEQIQDKTDELEEHTSQAYLNVVKAFENMAKLAGIGLDTGATTQKTQSSWYVNKDGTAPSQAKKGDIIYTKGGTYEITGKDENGKFTSKKLDNKSTPITDGMWGKKISEEVIKTTEDVTDSVENIIRVNEDLVDKTKKQILTDANLQKYIDENSKYTQDEIIALMDNEEVMDMLSDYTDDNSDATADNTDALYRFIDTLANLELEVPLEEMTLENFDDSVMDEKDQAYVKELQRAWNLAMEQGNIELANQIHAMADEARMRYLDDDPNNDYNAIAESFSKLEDSKYEYSYSTQIGGKNGDSEATQKYLDNISWLRGKADWSDEFIDRLDNVVDAIENGNGLTATVYEDQYGRTSTIIDYTEKKTLNTNKTSGNKTQGQKNTETHVKEQSDRDKIADAQKKYNEAKAKGDKQGMADAHAEAEAVRNKYGYSGGDDGSQHIVTSNKKSAKSTDENTRATDDNTDSNYEASDTNKEVADSNKELSSSNKTLAESNEKLAKSNSSSGSSGGSSGGSGGGKSSGNKSSGSGSSSSSSNRVTWSKKDNGDGTTTHTAKDSSGNVKASYTTSNKKKAKGGLNLPEDNYIVNEKGDETIVEPDEGNWVRLGTGSSVIPHEASKNMWEFGANPKMFLSDVLGYDAMKMNQQIIYTGSNGGEKVIQYHIGSINPTLPNVTKPDEFWDEFTRNLPNEAKQWGTTGY